MFHPCGSHSLTNVFSIELFCNIKHRARKSANLSSLLKLIQFTFKEVMKGLMPLKHKFSSYSNYFMVLLNFKMHTPSTQSILFNNVFPAK